MRRRHLFSETNTRGVLPRVFVCLAIALASVSAFAQAADSSAKWWKGNLHTHSFWSDGNDFPEMIVDWYRKNGYHFLGLSDHNTLQTGERWKEISTNGTGPIALEKYLKRFGESWVEIKQQDGKRMIRLKTLEEFRPKFEKAEEFLLIQCEEISDRYGNAPIHINASNLREKISPQGGNSVLDVMQNNVNAILAQREKTGQPMIPHINHPNFIWALTAEDLAQLKGEKFFEVYNGHPITKDHGDEFHASTDRIWDVLLTKRLAELNLPPIWGTAVDDSHDYHNFKVGNPNPGRGWIMVRADRLSPEAIIAAMEAGDFYASSGVILKDIRRSAKQLAIEIQSEPGVTYTTQFIGTRKGYDPKSEPVLDKDGKPLRTTRRYSKDVGVVLSEVTGTNPSYTLKGDELYVRAKVTSSRTSANPAFATDKESAWVQPVIGSK